MQSAYTLGLLLQCKHFNVRRLERYLWKLVYATIFFLFLPSISWTLKYVSQNFELIQKNFRVRHLQNSSLQAEILKKITLNFKSALPVRKLCQGTSATSATPVSWVAPAQFTIHWYLTEAIIIRFWMWLCLRDLLLGITKMMLFTELPDWQRKLKISTHYLNIARK